MRIRFSSGDRADKELTTEHPEDTEVRPHPLSLTLSP